MVNFDVNQPWSLKDHPDKDKIVRILSAAMEAVDPQKAVLKVVHRDLNHLLIGETTVNLDDYHRIIVIGAGKASFFMAKALCGLIGDKLAKGIVISKVIDQVDFLPGYPSVRILRGGHPIPDKDSVSSTQAIIGQLKDLDATDLVFCLISGGGSALLTQPVAGVSLEQLQNINRTLLACGASIDEINTIRKHLDEVKGGRLAGKVFPARLITLILSDVIGNPIEVIASGPTVADSTTYQDSLNIIKKYQVLNEVPSSIIDVLNQGQLGKFPETLKPGDPKISGALNFIIGSNFQACTAAMSQALTDGLNSSILTTYLNGEARSAGRFLTSILKQVVKTGNPIARPACIIAGGETTVVIKGNGLGGRNQELALSAISEIRGLEHIALITLATDGEDGPTDAAGAMVTGNSAARADQLGLDPQSYLEANNSYEFFKRLDDQIRIGSTGTNVNDLCFLFAF